MKIKRQVVIGFIFVASIAVLYWGINFVKGLDVFSSQRYFYAEYDNVSGLLVASPVTVSGYKVGQVTDISFKQDDPGRLLVKFVVTEDLDIPQNSVARIESADLLGSKAIVLHLGDSPVFAKSGSYLKGEMETSLKDEVSLQMLPLKTKVESLLSSFDSALAVVQYIFNENTRDNLAKTFESIRYTIASLERASSTIDTLLRTQQYKMVSIVSNVEAITLNIKNQNEEIANIIGNFSNLTDSLLMSNIKSTFENADKTMNELSEITRKINSGEGSMGLLLESDSIYIRLNQATLELKLLLEDMRLNPDRYIHFSVFGKGSKRNQYTPPESEEEIKE
jgi:phospholipid/cholesterol/gamma-HCH transport system substrate-binding protein